MRLLLLLLCFDLCAFGADSKGDDSGYCYPPSLEPNTRIQSIYPREQPVLRGITEEPASQVVGADSEGDTFYECRTSFPVVSRHPGLIEKTEAPSVPDSQPGVVAHKPDTVPTRFVVRGFRQGFGVEVIRDQPAAQDEGCCGEIECACMEKTRECSRQMCHCEHEVCCCFCLAIKEEGCIRCLQAVCEGCCEGCSEAAKDNYRSRIQLVAVINR